MEPMVLRRPLMAGRRRSEASSRGIDCRTITIIFMFAILLGMVIFMNYPSTGHTKSTGPGLLANIQDQATSWLGGQHKEDASPKPKVEKTEEAIAEEVSRFEKLQRRPVLDEESRFDADGFNSPKGEGLALDEEGAALSNGALNLSADDKSPERGSKLSELGGKSEAATDERADRLPIRIHKVKFDEPGEGILKSQESSESDESVSQAKDLLGPDELLDEEDLVQENNTTVNSTIGTGPPLGNTSCTGSACLAVPAINALFQDALNGGTLYIGPQPCSLFRQLSGSSLVGLEPSFQTTREEEQDCEGLPVDQVLPDELVFAIKAANTLSFKLVIISDTLEKMDKADAERVIAAVAERAEGPVLVAVSFVKPAYTSLTSSSVRNQGLKVYEKATFWAEAFAAEGLVESRDKLALLEEARGNLTEGAFFHLVQSLETSATHESSGPFSQGKAVPFGLAKSAAWSGDETAEEPSSASSAREVQEDAGRSNLLGPAAQPSSAWGRAPTNVGAPFIGAPGSRASREGEVQEEEGAKPALGLSFFSQFFTPPRAQQGAGLQEVLEDKALLQELESTKDEDLVTLDGSETESGVVSMEIAEDRKALNKRLPEVAKRATDIGAFRLRKSLLKRRRR